jgi:YbbR domain-containing protein
MSGTIRDFLLNNWVRKIFALAFSVGLYFYVGEMRIEDRVWEVPLLVSQEPAGLVPLNPLPRTVSVKVTGTMRRIRTLDPHQITAGIDMANAQLGQNSFPVELQAEGFPAGVELIPMVRVVRVNLDTKMERTLPVRARFTGRPASGFALQRDSVDPPQATVSGPASRLKGMQELELPPIDLADLKEDTVRVLSFFSEGRFLVVSGANSFRVSIGISPEQVFRDVPDLPVRLVGMPTNLMMRTTNASYRVGVRFSGGRAALDAFDPAGLEAYGNLARFTQPGAYLVPVRIPAAAHPGLSIDRITPPEITVELVEAVERLAP